MIRSGLVPIPLSSNALPVAVAILTEAEARLNSNPWIFKCQTGISRLTHFSVSKYYLHPVYKGGGSFPERRKEAKKWAKTRDENTTVERVAYADLFIRLGLTIQ